MVTFETTSKGKPMVRDSNNYTYVANTSFTEVKYWKYSVKMCSARIRTRISSSNLIGKYNYGTSIMANEAEPVVFSYGNCNYGKCYIMANVLKLFAYKNIKNTYDRAQMSSLLIPQFYCSHNFKSIIFFGFILRLTFVQITVSREEFDNAVSELNLYVKPIGLSAIKFQYTDWMDPENSRSRARKPIPTFTSHSTGMVFVLTFN